MTEVISDSDIFKLPIFKKGIKDFVLSKEIQECFGSLTVWL